LGFFYTPAFTPDIPPPILPVVGPTFEGPALFVAVLVAPYPFEVMAFFYVGAPSLG